MSTVKDEAQDFCRPTKWELQAKENEEREAEAKAVASKLFSPSELTMQSKQIHEAAVPVLGKLRYGELTLDDSFTIAKCKTDADKSCMAAYLILKKAYPEMPLYTPENIGQWSKSMPLAEGAALLLFIRNTPAFLRTQSVHGLNQTKTRKK